MVCQTAREARLVKSVVLEHIQKEWIPGLDIT